MELKDVLQLAIGGAGWCLAVWQYWKNDLLRRPLVVIESDGFKLGDTGFGGGIIVRNRAPWDIRAVSMRAVKPAGSLMVIPGPAKKTAAVRPLHFKLDAYADGAFPSGSHWFAVEFPAGVSPKVAVIEVEIFSSKPIWFSNRFTTRHKVHRVKSKTDP